MGAGGQCRLLLGIIIHFDLLLGAAGAALWLWGAGVCKFLSRHSLVPLATLDDIRCLLPGLTYLWGHIFTGSQSAEKE